MEYLTHSLIDESEALQIVNKLKAEKLSWQDGKKTAGSHAAEIKSNFQLDKNSKLSIELRDIIVNKIISNPLLKSFTLPSLIHGVMFTQSLAGHRYGSHIDNPYMPSRLWTSSFFDLIWVEILELKLVLFILNNNKKFLFCNNC